MALGYAYPAYECFKTVEKNKADTEQLRFWCQYWILVALLTIFERIGDAFIAWVPMYSEAKLAFFIYLWYPKTRGTTYVYDTFFRPYLLMHEEEIERNLLELKARVGGAAGLFFQKATSYAQTRFYEILQYLASQSQYSRSQPTVPTQQQLQQHARQPPPIVTTAQPPEAQIQQQSQLRTTDPTSTPVKNQSLERKQEAAGSTSAPAASITHASSPRPAPSDAQSSGPSNQSEVEDKQVEEASSTTDIHESKLPQPKESIIQGIRARLRIRTPGSDASSDH